MEWKKINKGWYFVKGKCPVLSMGESRDYGTEVCLPHDYMIGNDVKEDCPAGTAGGFYPDGPAVYTKLLEIPDIWKGQKVYLYFDGAMMNASVFVNGSLVKSHHYGYTPFSVDLTDALYYGEENRIAICLAPSAQPNSRWYSGAGLYRNVFLAHCHKIHIAADGIYSYTKRLDGIQGDFAGKAFLMHEVAVENQGYDDRQVRVAVTLRNSSGQEVLERDTVVFVRAGATVSARIPMTLPEARLWDTEHPNLYRVKASVYDMGRFGVSLEKESAGGFCDRAEVSFGIRIISADAVNGLLINGKSVKIRGGCIHHDNGILGGVSLYSSEYRKISLLKEAGYNGVRMAHNPPSAVLLDVCDELGMYVMDEAFDAWRYPKVPGDYSQFFETDWQEDISAWVRRDRSHPSVIFWSTGNEVEERGGMAEGYALGGELAEFIRNLDSTRLITNGVCSMWNGLDDRSALQALEGKGHVESGQNSELWDKGTIWEDRTESFVNALDVVGYNYLESHYAYDHKRYPERVMVGTESYPKQMDIVWDMVEKLPCLIGDYTWTAFDYIGEAGIGRSVFLEKGDPRLAKGSYLLSSHENPYPWRLANDADFTINGRISPQGIFRRILWGSRETGIFTQNPANYGKEEVVSRWGWNEMSASWSYPDARGKLVKVYVYSGAKEVELFLNGKSCGKKEAGKQRRYQAVYELPYEEGSLEAVSYHVSGEVTRSALFTVGNPEKIILEAEREAITADGESLAYVNVKIADREGRPVPYAKIKLEAEVGESSAAFLAGFGSDIPLTEDNYTASRCVSWQGYALAVVRAGFKPGTAVLKVRGENLGSATLKIKVL